MPIAAKPIPELTQKERDRFLSLVDKKSDQECWIWKASKNEGYGQFHIKRIPFRAPRVAWYIAFAVAPPEHLLVCHRCDNPSCVNPAHLFLGTNLENRRDSSVKGRVPSGDRNGARLHPEKLARGEANGWAKLTNEMVREILHLRLVQGEHFYKIGVRFGVSKTCVMNVVKGKTWRHQTGPAILRAAPIVPAAIPAMRQ